MLFKIVDEFEVKFDVLVFFKGKRRDELVKILNKVAEDRYFCLFFNEAKRYFNQFLFNLIISNALIQKRETK